MIKKENYNGDEWPLKAYNNLDFINSSDGREIRVLCEFMEPRTRFRKKHVRDTIVCFGSARTLPQDVAQENLAKAEQDIALNGTTTEEQHQTLAKAKRDVIMARYYEDAANLAERITEWSMNLPKGQHNFTICTGGGPGIMEAANRGAHRAGGESIGLNISLPFEQHPNPYQSADLTFEFHYFFIRKFWFLYLAKAVVVFPGGFGTLDEMFEVMTLIQTNKTDKKIPFVIYGEQYWRDVLNLEKLQEWGMICEKDLELFHFSDDVDEAFEYLKGELTRLYLS